MKTTIWDALLSPLSNRSQTPCIAGLLCGEEESDGDRVRFGPPGDSPSVMLTRHGADYLSADVFLPAAGPGLTGEQERALSLFFIFRPRRRARTEDKEQA